MSEQQNNCPRQTAVNAFINWAKTGWGYYFMPNTVSDIKLLANVNFLYPIAFNLYVINPLTIAFMLMISGIGYPIINIVKMFVQLERMIVFKTAK